jgi:hypothetical protein
VSMLSSFSTGQWLVVCIVWLLASFGTSALLARLYKRLHPELSFHKLWAFWTVLVSLTAALVLATGLI